MPGTGSETCESRDGEGRFPRSKSLHAPLVSNPFVHRLRLTTRDKIQIAIMSVTIAPIRLVLMAVFLLFAWLFAKLAVYGRTKEDEDKPMSGWRNAIRPLPVLFCRAVYFAGGFHWITVKGKRVTSKDAPILTVAPHSSYMDAILSTKFGLTTTVAKADSELVPFFGILTHFTQPVLVSREDPNSRQNTIKEIRRRANAGGSWPQVMIFPEGTCTNRSCLIAFKPGAFYPGAPVQPVCVKYPNRLDTISWTWDGPGALSVLWLTICQFHTSCEIEFLDVHVPTEEEKSNPLLFARNVRNKMAECLKVPTTDHTFEDCRLMLYASQLDFPAASGLVEFQKLSKKLGMTFDGMKRHLEKFASIAQKNKGQVTIEEFADYLEFPVSDTLKEMFEIYDRDCSGTIDFREYVIGLHVVAKPANTDEMIQFAFRVFDKGDKGYITEPELSEILHNAFGMKDEDVAKLFVQVDQDSDSKITFEEFKDYAEKRPEYARLFMTHQQLKANQTEEEAIKQSQVWGVPQADVNGHVNVSSVNSLVDKLKSE